MLCHDYCTSACSVHLCSNRPKPCSLLANFNLPRNGCKDHRRDWGDLRPGEPAPTSLRPCTHAQAQGFEVLTQLLVQTGQSYRFILGCRDTQVTGKALDGISYEKAKHNVKLLPLNLSNLKTVKSFASDTLTELGSEKLDCLFLNAALITHSKEGEAGPHGSKWGESCVVNHFCT